MSATVLSPEGNQIGAGNIQADIGGIINIHKAPDANDTKTRRLWEFRKKYGMCVHCGNKTHKRKRKLGVVVVGWKPLDIPGFVLKGVCIHPNCRPVQRTNIEMTTGDDSDEDEDSDAETVTNEYDSVMSAVAEYRHDLKRQIEKVKKSSEQAKAANAAKLEEVIVQLNRSVEQAQRYDKQQLDAVRDELKADVELARTTLESHSIRLDRAEHGIEELKSCLILFQIDTTKQMKEMQQEINYLKRQLAEQQQSSSSMNAPPPTTPTVPKPSTPARLNLVQGPMNGHTGSVSCCAVFANDTRALSGSGDKTLRVWDLATGATLSILNGHEDYVRCCAVFANDTRALSGSCDKTLRVWDLATGATLSILNGHEDYVRCCAVFAKDTRALSGSKDNTLRVWDLATGASLSILNGHTNYVWCCAVFTNDTRALSGSWDNTLRVWDLATVSDSDMHGGNDSEDEDDDSHYDTTGAPSVPQFLFVTGAGRDEVNGKYKHIGSFEDYAQYVKRGIWGSETKKFSIFLCHVSNNTKHWYISIIPNDANPGTSSDIDFYTAPMGDHGHYLPPPSGWVKAAQGLEPAPRLSFRAENDLANQDSLSPS